ncbi:hypothetical protein IAT40_000284 [Kwoniella sp. CBS 6097]
MLYKVERPRRWYFKGHHICIAPYIRKDAVAKRVVCLLKTLGATIVSNMDEGPFEAKDHCQLYGPERGSDAQEPIPGVRARKISSYVEKIYLHSLSNIRDSTQSRQERLLHKASMKKEVKDTVVPESSVLLWLQRSQRYLDLFIEKAYTLEGLISKTAEISRERPFETGHGKAVTLSENITESIACHLRAICTEERYDLLNHPDDILGLSTGDEHIFVGFDGEGEEIQARGTDVLSVKMTPRQFNVFVRHLMHKALCESKARAEARRQEKRQRRVIFD